MTTITGTRKNGCRWDQAEWVFTYVPPYLWFIFILGSIENLFVIFVFVLHKSRCTVTEIYLGNMAAADLIFVSMHPFTAIFISNKYHWPFGGFMFKAHSCFSLLNLYVSIYFLMMVSIERRLALVKPMSISRLRRPLWAKVICGIIWMFAVVLFVPREEFREVVCIEQLNITTCRIVFPVASNYLEVRNITMNVVGFLVPLIVTSFCTFQIIHVLKNNSMRQFKKVNKERKATRLVLSVFLAFILCWLPYNIYIFIETLHSLKPCTVSVIVNDTVSHISLIIAYSNSCINPVIYNMVGNQFRQKAREVYSRFLCRGPDRTRSSCPSDKLANPTQISAVAGVNAMGPC